MSKTIRVDEEVYQLLKDFKRPHETMTEVVERVIKASEVPLAVRRMRNEARLVIELGPPEAGAMHPLEVAPAGHASTARGYHRYGCRALGCV